MAPGKDEEDPVSIDQPFGVYRVRLGVANRSDQ
jgi:hypothetical protein